MLEEENDGDAADKSTEHLEVKKEASPPHQEKPKLVFNANNYG